MKKIILDCDPGVDDGLAILLALNSGKVDLKGISTVHGNSPLSKTTLNACRILDYMDRGDIMVARGAAKPLILTVEGINAESIHGNDGLGDSSLLSKTSARALYIGDAVDFLIEQVRSGVRTIVATGPLTNIALAFQKNGNVMKNIDELIIMGGAIHMPGNIDSLSEFNFYADPHAADYVMQNVSVRKVLVPLNVTHQVMFTPADRKALSDSPAGRLAKSIVNKYQKAYMDSGYKGNAMHDPLAMGYAIDSSFLRLKPFYLRVECEGKYTRGVCVPEERPWMKHLKPNVNVAVGVEAARFLKYFNKTVSK